MNANLIEHAHEERERTQGYCERCEELEERLKSAIAMLKDVRATTEDGLIFKSVDDAIEYIGRPLRKK